MFYFSNYRNNIAARKKCKKFIEQRIDGLGALQFIINGLSSKLRWKVDDVYLYFMEHKQNYQKIYNERASTQEEDGRIIEDLEGDNDGLALTITDNVEEDEPMEEIEDGRDIEDIVEEGQGVVASGEDDVVTRQDIEDGGVTRKSKRKKKDGPLTSKKHKKICDVSKDASNGLLWEELTTFDKTTLVQKLMGVDSRFDVEKFVCKWIGDRKKIHESYPKIKNARDMEDSLVIDAVAEWAFKTQKVVFIGIKGFEGISLEDWKVI